MLAVSGSQSLCSEITAIRLLLGHTHVLQNGINAGVTHTAAADDDDDCVLSAFLV